MTAPEDKDRRIRRIKNRIAKDLRSNKYGQRIVKDKEIYDRNKYRNIEVELEDDEDL